MVPDMKKATEEDWGTEYLDLIASVRTVASVDEAIEHINRYNTGHSEAIVTKDYANARKFLDEVDAAAVYVNASTVLQMDLNLVLVPKSASAHKNFMPEGRWG